MKLNIQIFGLGFVGLTTALAFSKKGLKIHGIEKNKLKLEFLKKSKIFFHEPYLEKQLKYEKKKNNFTYSNKFFLEKKKINVFFICVGTPEKRNGSANISEMENIIKDTSEENKECKIIFVIKSTVPPGTVQFLRKKYNSKNLGFVSNPEFLREGYAWKDFFNSGKIVVGYQEKFEKKIIEKIYKKFSDPIIFTSNNTAEFIKYLSNTFLASMISFSNEMTMFAEKFGNINIKDSFKAIKLDKRWNGHPCNMASYLHPGIGYGGYCLPKDVKALSYLMQKYKKNNFLKEVNIINNKIFYYQLNKILKDKNKNIFILGLSFKPGSDDIRNSISVKILKYLQLNKEKKIFACDYLSYKKVRKILSRKITFFKEPKIMNNATYVLCTAHKKYIDFLKKINKKQILDLRYLT